MFIYLACDGAAVSYLAEEIKRISGMPSSQYAIEVSGLAKFYGQSQVLWDLNLHVEQGTIFGIVGPNGAGKTTLLKIVAGIIRPAAGEVKILGESLGKDPEKVKSLIGYLPEKPRAYDVLTVKEFLEFIRELYSIPDAVFGERVEGYSKALGLGDYDQSFMGSLSKGLLQRVLLASIFVREPRIYLLDEPFSGLDPSGIWQLRRLLLEKVKSGGTVLMATHILDFAEKLCDRIAIISKGRILIEGTSQRLREAAGTERSLEEAYLKLMGEEP